MYRKHKTSAYNTSDLVTKIDPNIILSKQQCKELWMSLFSTLKSDKQSLTIYTDTEEKEHEKDELLRYGADSHRYDFSVSDRCIKPTPQVTAKVEEWLLQNKSKVYFKDTLTTFFQKLDIDELEFAEFENMDKNLLPKDVFRLIKSYFTYGNSCRFCHDKNMLTKYICTQTHNICVSCGVSDVHHWRSTTVDFNVATHSVYNCIMEPVENFVVDATEREEDSLHCPFGICRCCDKKIPSYFWPNLSFGKNTYYGSDLSNEFDNQVEKLDCRYCLSCNPKRADGDLYDHECQHVKATLTTFRSRLGV